MGTLSRAFQGDEPVLISRKNVMKWRLARLNNFPRKFKAFWIEVEWWGMVGLLGFEFIAGPGEWTDQHIFYTSFVHAYTIMDPRTLIEGFMQARIYSGASNCSMLYPNVDILVIKAPGSNYLGLQKACRCGVELQSLTGSS